MRTLPEYTGPALGCNIVKVTGQVLDLDADPYGPVFVKGPGDVTTASDKGKFTLLVPRGTVKIEAFGVLGFASGAQTVRAIKKVNSARIKIFPAILFPSTSASELSVQVDGLPRIKSKGPDNDYRLAIKRRNDEEGTTFCRFQKSVFFDPGRSRHTTFEIDPSPSFSSFCPGDYAAVLYDPDRRELQTQLFSVLE